MPVQNQYVFVRIVIEKSSDLSLSCACVEAIRYLRIVIEKSADLSLTSADLSLSCTCPESIRFLKHSNSKIIRPEPELRLSRIHTSP